MLSKNPQFPRPGRHLHFSVRLAFDHDSGLIARREFFENFFGRVCSHNSFTVKPLPDLNQASTFRP
jgi:hypothetical protein